MLRKPDACGAGLPGGAAGVHPHPVGLTSWVTCCCGCSPGWTSSARRRSFASADSRRGRPRSTSTSGQAAEVEAFSADTDWMPRAVMIAKNALVWLDQLSRAYGREIRRLDQVPDEELDRLAGAGFTALWLIGVWERSARLPRDQAEDGKPGGGGLRVLPVRLRDGSRSWAARSSLDNLKDARVAPRHPLASDMVPNHTGARLAVDGGAPRAVPFVAAFLAAVPLLQLQRARHLADAGRRASTWRTTTGTRRMPPWSSSAWTTQPATRA